MARVPRRARGRCAGCNREPGFLFNVEGRALCLTCAPDDVVEASNYGKWNRREEFLDGIQEELSDMQDALDADEFEVVSYGAEQARAPWAPLLAIVHAQVLAAHSLLAEIIEMKNPDALELAYDDPGFATEAAESDACECGHDRWTHRDSYSRAPGLCLHEDEEGTHCHCGTFSAVVDTTTAPNALPS